MGRRSKRATRNRQAAEFNASQLTKRLSPPMPTVVGGGMTLEEIMAARDAQMRGQFGPAVRLARNARTDDAIYVAHDNRLAPQRCLGVKIDPSPNGGKAEAIAGEAEALYGKEGVGIAAGAVESIHSDIIDHQVAIGYVEHVPRGDGSRVDLILHHWPLEFVRYDHNRRTLVTRVDAIPPDLDPECITGANEIKITHGDGRWIVFSSFQSEPWTRGAIVASSLVWARHTTAVRDWANASTTHGNAKVIGEMAENVHITDANGDLTDEAQEFAVLLRAIASHEQPVGIRPAGSKTEYLTNNSRAWQVWEQLSLNAEKAAARIYLGTDGALGSVGGAPGVDIASLFSIAATKVQGDLTCLERGFRCLLEMWAAINFGDSTLTPSRTYQVPDGDSKVLRTEYAQNSVAFWADIKSHRENGFVVDQALATKLAEKYGVEAPTLLEPPRGAPAQQGGDAALPLG